MKTLQVMLGYCNFFVVKIPPVNQSMASEVVHCMHRMVTKKTPQRSKLYATSLEGGRGGGREGVYG